MTEEADDSPPPEFYPCDSCGWPVAPDEAYAPREMPTLQVFCHVCLRKKLSECEECGQRVFVSAYLHLPSGTIFCEPCFLRVLDRGDL